MSCVQILAPPFASSVIQLPCLCNGDNKNSSLGTSQNKWGDQHLAQYLAYSWYSKCMPLETLPISSVGGVSGGDSLVTRRVQAQAGWQLTHELVGPSWQSSTVSLGAWKRLVGISPAAWLQALWTPQQQQREREEWQLIRVQEAPWREKHAEWVIIIPFLVWNVPITLL